MGTSIHTSHTIIGVGDTMGEAIADGERHARVFARALSKVGADASVIGIQTLVVIEVPTIYHLITYAGLGIEEARAETGYSI